MLDHLQERERLREERKRVRADMLVERLRDGSDAAVDAADGAFRRIWRAISWTPERMRHRLLLGIPGLAVLALAYFLAYFHDAPPVATFVLASFVPLALAVLTSLIARGYLARRAREEAVSGRQRGAR